MSNTDDQENGGASITPSARPSIHSHVFCPFALAETMGRYRIDRNKLELRTQSSNHRTNLSNDQGTDEVDNIFSKPSQQISPSSFTQINKNRRKSLDGDEEEIDRDSNKLSKSLPATFSPHSRCSDESVYMDEVPARNDNPNSDTSYHSESYNTPQANRSSPVIRLSSSNTGRTFNSPDLMSHAQALQFTKAEEVKSSSKFMFTLLIVGVLVAGASMLKTTNISNNVIYDESRFYNDIDRLGHKYGINENAVLQMQTGISTIFEKQDTGSFMFVYDSEDNNFIPSKFNMLVSDVSNIASKYLRNESTPVHYTLVEGSTLNMIGPSDLISTFREDLDKTGVMLVKHIDAIPSALAMAFHFYCDEYNPLVKKSAIFFTLNLAKCAEIIDKKATHAVIEKCLAQKWKGVPADSIGPLLTRVVNVVIDLTGPL